MNNKSTKWNPSPEDVKILCDAVLDNYIGQDRNNGGDYCSQCGEYYGNIALYGKRLPHKKDCPVLVAQDVLTGIELPGNQKTTV